MGPSRSARSCRLPLPPNASTRRSGPIRPGCRTVPDVTRHRGPRSCPPVVLSTWTVMHAPQSAFAVLAVHSSALRAYVGHNGIACSKEQHNVESYERRLRDRFGCRGCGSFYRRAFLDVRAVTRARACLSGTIARKSKCAAQISHQNETGRPVFGRPVLLSACQPISQAEGSAAKAPVPE